jgi:hypothetical protein
MPAVARSGSGRRCLVCRGTLPCESHWAWASFSVEFSVSCRCLDSGCFRLDCWCSPSICRWSGAGAGLSWCAGNDGTARESSAKAPHQEARQKRMMRGNEWRPRPESNRGARICSPLRNHSATRPHAGYSPDGWQIDGESQRRKGHLGLRTGFSSASAVENPEFDGRRSGSA